MPRPCQNDWGRLLRVCGFHSHRSLSPTLPPQYLKSSIHFAAGFCEKGRCLRREPDLLFVFEEPNTPLG